MASIQELDARQRMINMMYIIFIAMLALNMSKEVLQAFGDVNGSLESNIQQTSQRNSQLMAGLATKADEQPEKYKPLKQQAEELHAAGNELVSYIDKLKNDLEEGVARDENGNLIYTQMDSDTEIKSKVFDTEKESDDA